MATIAAHYRAHTKTKTAALIHDLEDGLRRIDWSNLDALVALAGAERRS